MKNQQAEEQKILPVTNAPPPLHSMALVGCIMVFFVSTLPSLESLDEVATVQTFTNRVFPELVSLEFLAWFRAICGALMIALQINEVFRGGWEQNTSYLPKTKLKNVIIQMRGIRTMMTFTSWHWNILAASFAMNAYIAFKAQSENEEVSQWILRVAVVMFEIAGPMTLLVSMVVRYSIWPNILKQGNNTTELKKIRTLLWHNANVVLALSEVGLLGGLPVRFSDFSVAPLFGISYVLFTWSRMYKWVPEAGPQFIYFFFDTTLEKTTSIVLMALLAVLTTFYGLFGIANVVLHQLGGGPIVHALVILVICSFVCRFRD